ncbi:MAG: hypothetical protein ACPGUD_09795 [Parashewanella sp.]
MGTPKALGYQPQPPIPSHNIDTLKLNEELSDVHGNWKEIRVELRLGHHIYGMETNSSDSEKLALVLETFFSENTGKDGEKLQQLLDVISKPSIGNPDLALQLQKKLENPDYFSKYHKAPNA